MKIIQIIPEFGLAGAEIMCENLIYALSNLGHEVIPVSFYKYESAITNRLEQNGFKVVYLNKHRGPDLGIVFKIKSLVKRIKPDVIHTHRYAITYVGLSLLLNKSVKIVHTVHSVAKKENKFFGRAFNHLLFKKKNYVPVALSKKVQSSIGEEYKIKEENIPVVFNGIDLTKCPNHDRYNESNNLVFLHVGRMTGVKNHINLIKAFALSSSEHPGISLSLIGDGDCKASIIDLIRELNIEEKVNLIGLTDNVFSYMKKADVFILPSHYEGMPMTLIEAMGSCLSIVTTPVGGIPDMLENEKSAIFVDTSVQSIHEGIERIIKSGALRETIRKNAYAKSFDFSSEKMAERYVSIYESDKNF